MTKKGEKKEGRGRAQAGARSRQRPLSELLVRTFERSRRPTAILDPQHQIIAVNPALCKITGRSEEDLLGRFCFEVFHGGDASAPVETCPAERLLHSKRTEINEMELDGLGGGFTTICMPIFDEGGDIEALIHIAVDVRERLSVDGQLRTTQRMEALGRLASGVAHDFNNILTVILTSVRFVYDSLTPQDPRRSDLREALAAADSARTLTKQLLAFSRRQDGEPRVININDAILQIDKMIRRTLGANIEIVCLLGESLWPCCIDPGQLDQVLVNLAVNARDAMPEGGTLTIETRNTSIRRTTDGVPAGDYVLLQVSDTGAGMSESVRSRVFEPFFTTKGKQGTGLGLSICYGVIAQARGHIAVRSKQGSGTAFRMYLPRVAGEPIPSRAPRQAPSETPGNSRVTVVVDDQPAVLRAMRRTLRSAGFVVLDAGSAEEALAAIKRLSTRVDLVVSDVVLPNMSGFDLVNKIHARYPETQVLLVSGYLEDDHPARATLRKGVPLLKKPFTAKQLLDKVCEVLERAPVPD